MECVICFSDYDDDTVMVLECCKNKLHKECFEKSLNINNMCPFCRKEYPCFNKIYPVEVVEHVISIDITNRYTRCMLCRDTICACLILTIFLSAVGGFFYIFTIGVL